MKRILLFALMFLVLSGAKAQSLEQRQQSEQNIVVLTNKKCTIPFVFIDTLKIGVTGDFDNHIFVSSVSRYTKLYPADKANFLLVTVSDFKEFNFKDIKKPYAAIIFDTTVTDVEDIVPDARSIVLVLQRDSLTEDYTGQLLFGAFAATGVLPRDIGMFDKGYGVHTRGGLRFKYTIPQEAGLDSAYIFSKVDSIAELGIKVGAYPGCQVFAAVDGNVIFYKSYGFHTYDSIIPVRNTDLYDLASVTKIAASVPCLMKLYDQGQITLDTRLGDICWCIKHSDKADILLRDALTHRAGLTPWIPFWKYTLNHRGELKRKYFRRDSSRRYPFRVSDSLYSGYRTRRFVFRMIKKSKLLPAGKYRYSDLSFYFYPYIVENLTGKSFEQCLYENFYHPLGAYSMVFNPYKYFNKNSIVPTEYDSLFRKTLIHATVHDEGAAMMGGVSGHAGLFANANDLAKLMQMYLNYGTYGGERYLSDTTVRRWTSYQFADEGNRRGLGFDKPLLEHPERGTPSPMASPESFGHSGFTGTFTWADPETGLLIVFLSNRVYPTRENKNLIHYNIRTHIHDVFYKAIEKRDSTDLSEQ